MNFAFFVFNVGRCPKYFIATLCYFLLKTKINLILSPYKGKNIATALKWLPRPAAESVSMVFLIDCNSWFSFQD